jgi:3-methyladenine DNA glycosylase AlkD
VILTKAILKNNNTKEFFIDKAIGWALRQYARTNAVWVREFVEFNRISKLSKREALKWI